MVILIADNSDTVVYLFDLGHVKDQDWSCHFGPFDERIPMKTLLTLVLAGSLCSAGVQAHEQASTDLSGASALIAGGSALVLAGSLSAVAASGGAVIASVQVVGESVIVVLEGASEAARATIQLSAFAVGGVSLVAGTAVSVVLIASGTVLVVAGEAIAFIPSAAAKSLIYHSRIGAGGY
jgi:hypothetical protein